MSHKIRHVSLTRRWVLNKNPNEQYIKYVFLFVCVFGQYAALTKVIVRQKANTARLA